MEMFIALLIMAGVGFLLGVVTTVKPEPAYRIVITDTRVSTKPVVDILVVDAIRMALYSDAGYWYYATPTHEIFVSNGRVSR